MKNFIKCIIYVLLSVILLFYARDLFNFIYKLIIFIFDNYSDLYPNIKSTLFIAICGLLLSVLISIIIAVILDILVLLRFFFIPLIYISQLFPTIILAPLYVMAFGYTIKAKILVVISCCFFPIVINLINALKSYDVDRINLIYNLGGNKFDVIRYIKFPNSLRALFAGLKISSSFCISATLVAEWLGGSKGVGIVMIIAKKSFNYEMLYACTLIVVIMSILLLIIVQIIEIILIKRRIL